MLAAIAIMARTFLIPHWQRWHDLWGPPAPAILSQWTCVRSSVMLARALQREGIGATFQSGRPIEDQLDTTIKRHGLLTASGWVSHAWVEANDFIVDITADQFGYPPVVVTLAVDPAYQRGEDEPHRLPPTPAGIAAIDEIWQLWCDYADRQHALKTPFRYCLPLGGSLKEGFERKIR